jgi:CRP-like cAMP-binding protein
LLTHEEAILQLQKFISPIHPLREEEWNAFASVWQPFSAKRKTVLTAAGDTEKYLYFVTEGVQRAFYQGDDGKEATIVFTYPFSFSGVADSFLLQIPSKYCLETLTKSEFIRTTFHQLQELMDRYHNFEKLIRKATNYTLAGVLERQVELQCFSAEQKFRTLLKRSPHVLTLIPHKYLASYLGLDATTFSKLLGSVRI